MSTATATFSDNTKTIGDKIAGLTLKEAKELSDYLKDVYGIEPAAGGAVMMAAAPTEAAGKPVVQTEFDVILKGFDPARKVNVIKLVREITAMSLMDGKKAVEAAPDQAQGRDQQGRGRTAQEEGRGSRRPGGNQVVTPQHVARGCVLTALRCPWRARAVPGSPVPRYASELRLAA